MSPRWRERVAIFVGPSLYSSLIEHPLGAAFLPPIRSGHLAALPGIGDGGYTICIIDGEFGQSLAVSVTEIRTVLEAGNRVIGCSSMGALRAMECAPIGMTGEGWVFEQFASGALDGDDEVALTYDPFSYEPHTVPLVNLRWLAARLVRRRLLAPASASLVIGAARDIPFPVRTLSQLRKLVSGLDISERETLLRYLIESREPIWDRKRIDAAATLGRLESQLSGHSERVKVVVR